MLEVKSSTRRKRSEEEKTGGSTAGGPPGGGQRCRAVSPSYLCARVSIPCWRGAASKKGQTALISLPSCCVPRQQGGGRPSRHPTCKTNKRMGESEKGLENK